VTTVVGCGRDFQGQERGFVRGGRGSNGGRQSVSKKAPDNVGLWM